MLAVTISFAGNEESHLRNCLLITRDNPQSPACILKEDNLSVHLHDYLLIPQELFHDEETAQQVKKHTGEAHREHLYRRREELESEIDAIDDELDEFG